MGGANTSGRGGGGSGGGGCGALQLAALCMTSFALGAVWNSVGQQSSVAPGRETPRSVAPCARPRPALPSPSPASSAAVDASGAGGGGGGGGGETVPIWVADLKHGQTIDFEAHRNGRFFNFTQYQLMRIIHTRLLRHPWRRVSDRAAAKVWFVPGWESCEFSDWGAKGPCFQEVTALMDGLDPTPSQRVVVLTSSRVSLWAYRYPFIWNHTYFKLTPEDFYEGSCERPYGDTWVAVPDVSSYLRPCEPLPFTPRSRGLRTIACEVGARSWRTELIEGCKVHPEVEYKEPQHVKGRLVASDTLARYESTVFSFQPRGDTYTRKGVMDALATGNIPIIFDRRTFGYPFVFPFDEANGTILLHLPALGQSVARIVDYVKAMPDERVLAMQRAVHEASNRLGYSGCPEVKPDGLLTGLIRSIAARKERPKCPGPKKARRRR